MQREDKLYRIRHSTAHVMAEAVLEIFPDAKLAIGPPIEDGFYYDFDLPRSLTEGDLADIGERMKRIMSGQHRFERRVVSREEAKALFGGQAYKLELIDGLPEGEEISLYTQDTFTDLCRGPHVESTEELDPEGFKLLSVAGAYWRGSERNPMLQRIYGTAWESKAELDAYLARLEEIEKRDHRKLGRELDLFSIQDDAGPGLIYWHPNGARVRLAIEDFWRREHLANGYEIVFSPHLARSWLWKTSGHLANYADIMFSPMDVDGNEYYVKPMNCPFHIMMYRSDIRSYRDLPIRMAELGTVYRYERSGVLHGLMRVRGFTQDDAHIFCSPEQVGSEIREVLRFSLGMWKAFGFTEIKAYLATRPAGKSVGEDVDWKAATRTLAEAIEAEGMTYELDEGGGAFYGPKIDLKIKDAIGREWQTTTVQFDFNLPALFDLRFVDRDGKEKRPVMVHRALLGSIERFFGVLIEHYSGAFPVWLAPLKAKAIPVAPAFNAYAESVARFLEDNGVHARADLGDQRMNAKIRLAQAEKVPYTLVVGEKERGSNTVSIRVRGGEQLSAQTLPEFLGFVRGKIERKELI